MERDLTGHIREMVRLALEVAGLVLLAVVIWRIASVEMQIIEFRFSDLLALLLALFAVGLSAAFYFRTTETSNRFYDSTFRFTKDISETLGRIEERFGERLRHIDESYSGLSSKLLVAEKTAEGAAKEVEAEREELRRIADEKQELVEQLLERAQVSEAERDTIRQRLSEQEKHLDMARRELHMMVARYEDAQARADQLRVRLAHEGSPSPPDRATMMGRFRPWFDNWIAEQSGLLPHDIPLPIAERHLANSLEKEDRGPLDDAVRLGYFTPGEGWSPRGRRLVHSGLMTHRPWLNKPDADWS